MKKTDVYTPYERQRKKICRTSPRKNNKQEIVRYGVNTKPASSEQHKYVTVQKKRDMPPYGNTVPINIDLVTMLKNKDPINPMVKEFFEYIRNGKHSKIKRMVKDKCVDINARDTEHPLLPTPLLVAAELEDLEILKLLLKAKPTPANINDENIRGRRAIWLAAKQNNIEMVELLLNANAKCEVNVVDKETGCAPLFTAVISNAVEVCRLLVRAGADVNLRRLGYDCGNETPLIKAIQLDNRDICELLINSLCKLQMKTDLGLTALHYAVAYCRYDICELLIENGIKVHAKSNAGVTSMAVAIENHNAAMVRLLLKSGYKMDKRYKWKETPLEQAIKLHATNCALTMLHFGCSINKPKGSSYMYMAIDEKLFKIAKFLIALDPQTLNEEWLQNQRWPVSIYHRPDVFKWLTKEASMPRKLKELCRIKIFRALGRYAPNKAQALPLPSKLKEYVQYKEFVHEEYYKQQPLDGRKCPFECPAICSIKHCAPIEISSSESGNDSDDDLFVI